MGNNSRLNQSRTATVDASGNVRVSFNPPDGGWVWQGSMYPIGAPALAMWTITVGGVNWGTYGGSQTTQTAQIQAWASESVVIVGVGFTPGSSVTFQWIGVEVPLQDAYHMGPVATALTAVVASSGGFATISFVGAASGNTGAGTAATSVTATLPAGILAGDIMIVQVVKQPAGVSVSFTIGGVAKAFTSIRDDSTSGSVLDARSRVLYRIADGTESSLALVCNSSNNDEITMSVLVYRNVNTVTPVSTSSANVSAANVATIATVTVTTVIANQWVLSLFSKMDSTAAGDVLSLPASTTSRQSNATQLYSGLRDADEIQAVAGATSARTSTVATACAMIAQAIALTPAAA